MKIFTLSKNSFTLLAFLVSSVVLSQKEIVTEKSQKQVLQDMLKKMDENKDGKLTLGEAKGILLLNFTTLDVNKDGVLTREDLEKFELPETPTPE